MSLAIYVRSVDAQIIAADSRMTLRTETPGRAPDLSFLDGASKVWNLPAPHEHIGVGGFGDFGAGGRSVGDLLLEFARGAPRGTVEKTASALGPFMAGRLQGRISLFVCGYDDTAYFGRSFLVSGGKASDLHGHGAAGLSLGGQKAVADAVVSSLKIPLEFMSPEDAVGMARWLIEVTEQAQGYSQNTPTVGGETRVLMLRRGQVATFI